MKIKCDWCGSWINDFDQVCPNCGGVNNNYNRHANGVPQTIEELKAWAKEMNLPLEEMRTFIGEDYKGAKAFGIYKDETDGTFVVYKNKEDGTRAVRYKGTDEAYAVNELYQKMKERVAVQKAHQQPKAAKPASGASVAAQQRQSGKNLSKALFPICLITIVAVIILSVVFALIGESGPDTGYYTYGGRSYYYYGDWYEWENDSWQYAPYRTNPGWTVTMRVTTIPTAMTAVRTMRILRIPRITPLMMTAATMTIAGMMTAGTPVGIPATAGTLVMMTGDPTGKM